MLNLVKLFEDFDPMVGGTVLVLSKKYPDGLKRVFLTRILEYRKEKGTAYPKITVRIDRKNMYLLNELEYDEGKTEIWGDRVEMNGDDLKNVMNMSSEWVVINDNKTPFGQYSIEFAPIKFLEKFQENIKSLKISSGVKFSE
jgi:hypothetical protein